MHTHSKSGQGLVSVMVGMGILSTLILSIFAILEFANKSYAGVKNKVAELQSTTSLLQLLASPKNCSKAFRDALGQPVTLNTQSGETVIDQVGLFDASGKAVLTLATTTPESEIKKYALKNRTRITMTPVGELVAGSLEFSALLKIENIPSFSTPQTHLLNLRTNNMGMIESCSLASTGPSQITEVGYIEAGELQCPEGFHGWNPGFKIDKTIYTSGVEHAYAEVCEVSFTGKIRLKNKFTKTPEVTVFPVRATDATNTRWCTSHDVAQNVHGCTSVHSERTDYPTHRKIHGTPCSAWATDYVGAEVNSVALVNGFWETTLTAGSSLASFAESNCGGDVDQYGNPTRARLGRVRLGYVATGVVSQ